MKTEHQMAYRLAVDLGTTYTAAAVLDRSGQRVAMLGLGNRSLQVPSVVFLNPDGTFLVGEPAERRGASEPGRLAREFKRRMGDAVPLIVAGTPISPQQLSAELLRWVVERATTRFAEPPDEIVLTHPANWGQFKRDLLTQTASLAEVGPVVLHTEPEAAATQYATHENVPVGGRIAVYDLGGGTFDACVLEKSETGFATLGVPDGVEQLGGVDFDEAVFAHVQEALGPQASQLDPDDPDVRLGLARLRRDCVEAKEALSSDFETVIPIALPGITTSVRLTRAELEGQLRPALTATLRAMTRALRSASTQPSDLHAIVLVGGSAQIPLVAEVVGQEFGLSPSLDTDPKGDVALGAVRIGITGPIGSAAPTSAVAPAPVVPAAAPVTPEPTPVLPEPTPEPEPPKPEPPKPEHPKPEHPKPEPPKPEPAPPRTVTTRPSAPKPPRTVAAAVSPSAARPESGPAEPAVPAAAAAKAASSRRPATPQPAARTAPVPPSTPVPAGDEPAWWRRPRIIAIAAAVVVVGGVVGALFATGVLGGDDPADTGPGLAPASVRPTASTSSAGPSRTPTASADSSIRPVSAALGDDQLVIPLLGELMVSDGSAGAKPTKLTQTPVNDGSVALSPDRRTLLWISRPPGDTSTSKGAVLNVAGATDLTGVRPVFTKLPAVCAGQLFRPAFDPSDSDHFAMPCQDTKGRYGIYLFDLNGKRLGDPVVSGRDPLDDVTFSPTGDQIAYSAPAGTDGATIMVADTEPGSTGAALTQPKKGQRDADPAWSPDGSQIAFRRLEGDANLWLVPVDGNAKAKRLTDAGTDEQDPTWSPDGASLAFKRSPRSDPAASAIWSMSLDATDEADWQQVLDPTKTQAGPQSAPVWAAR